jgi:glycosyltransferase involved in cell wall biosynthesis
MLRHRTVMYYIEYQPNKLGFTEMYALQMVRALRKEGCRVILVFPSLPFEDLRKQYVASGAIVEALSAAQSSDYTKLKDLRRLLRGYRPDILHTRHRYNFTFLPLLLRLCGARRIILSQEHAWEVGAMRKKNPLKRNLIYLRNRLTCWPLDRVVPVSEYVKRCVLESRGIREEKIKVIYNGIDLGRYEMRGCGATDGRNGDEDIRYVSTISWINPVKGLSYFLEACQTISRIDPRMRFFFVTYGGNDDIYREQARELGILDKVVFLQHINDTERIYSLSTVFVCPSICQEAFGAVIAEAMACGVPVVATKVGGIPEIVVDGETGMLVDPKDADAIAQSCLKILSDNELRENMAIAGRRRVEDLFDQKRMVRETIELYQEII